MIKNLKSGIHVRTPSAANLWPIATGFLILTKFDHLYM